MMFFSDNLDICVCVENKQLVVNFAKSDKGHFYGR